MDMLDHHVSLPDIYRRMWRRPDWAERVALIGGEEVIRYAELAERVDRIAAGLHSQGVVQGQCVAIAMERSPDMVLAILGTLCAGACPCPLEPGLARLDVDLRLSATGVEVLLWDAGAAHLAEGQSVHTVSFERVREGSAAAVSAVKVAVQDRALLLFTSGSTGRPKGVLLSHGNLLSNARGLVAHGGVSPDDRLLHMMPLHHTNGLNNQLFTPLAIGACVVFCDRFKAELVPGLLERYRPTIITGVPTMYARMLPQAFSAAGLSGLRMARCGSAPLSVELHREIEARLGAKLVVSYGLSEATCTSTMNPPDSSRIGSVGTVMRGQTVRLFDHATGDEVEPGQEGEICIGGPSVMLGYVGADPNESLRAVRKGWLQTGDLGRFDPEGYLYVTGRIKDVIIRGGENLSPQAIENVINSNAGVAACCVVGSPDRDLGEVPVAFVVRHASAPVNEDDIKMLVRSKLPRTCQLHGVIFVDHLPETAIGKVDRKRLSQYVRSAQEMQSSS